MVDSARLIGALTGSPRYAGQLIHVEQVPPRSARHSQWPEWTAPLLIDRLALRGIARPYLHQVAAAELAHNGAHVVLSTGTASGKSLGYLLPVATALLEDTSARALYLSPTKALAADQLRAIRDLTLTAVRAATYDGDTPSDERDWVRAHANLLLTNPDMLHRALLPQHQRWAAFFRGLRYVVIDECHGYRGVFGSHVAQILRRLRRICARYGSSPVFILASATVSAPEVSASRLTGVDVSAVIDDGSPRGATHFGLWSPR